MKSFMYKILLGFTFGISLTLYSLPRTVEVYKIQAAAEKRAIIRLYLVQTHVIL